MTLTSFSTRSILWLGFAINCLLVGCSKPSYNPDLEFKYDAESGFLLGDKRYNSKVDWFKPSKAQSEALVFSGSTSICLMKGKNEFGPTFVDGNAKPGDIYEVFVWKHGPLKEGVIIVTDKSNDFIYETHFWPDSIAENGWALLHSIVHVPPHFDGDSMMIYLWNKSTEPVYFDDLVIRKPKSHRFPDFSNSPKINLQIDKKDMAFLRAKRLSAFEAGILLRGDNDYIPSKIHFDEEKIGNAQIRLKGDFMDHLEGKKWSFRVKLKGDARWNGMKVFSIQNPNTRMFVHEWVLHELYKMNGVLTPRYGFVPVSVNGESRGVYAYEEHFTDQMLAHNNKQDLPILKFNEDGIWECHHHHETTGNKPNIPRVLAAPIEAFSMKKVLRSPEKMKHFLKGQDLIESFRHFTLPYSEVFDADAAARFYACNMLTGAFHGTNWHNQRFYLDPEKGKLLHIAFDGHTEDYRARENKRFLGFERSDTVVIDNFHMPTSLYPFRDYKFVSHYVKHLKRVSSEAYVDSVLKVMEDDILHHEAMVRKEFPYYRYDRTLLKDRAKGIREWLPEYEEQLQAGKLPFYEFALKKDPEGVDAIIIESLSVRCHLQNAADSPEIRVINYQPLPIIVVGMGNEGGGIKQYLKPGLELPGFDPTSYTSLVKEDIGVDAPFEIVYYKLKGESKLHTAKVFPWRSPEVLLKNPL